MLVNSGSNVFGCLLHRVGERRARLDVGPRLQDDRGEVLVLLLRAEDVEALHERQAGVDHDRELAGEDRQVLRPTTFLPILPAFAFGRRVRLRLGRRDPRDHDLLAPQRRDRGVHRVGDALAADRLSGARPSRICKCRHELHSLHACVATGRPAAARPSRRGRVPMPGAGDDADAAVDHVLQLVLQFDDALSAVSSVISRFM